MQTIKYRDWVFEVDYESTKYSYARVSNGGAEDCSCLDCKNYIAKRDNIFPEEIKNLFYTIGVDYKKDVEVLTLEPDKDKVLWGWFHFKGKLISGNDCKVRIDKNSIKLDLIDITENFSIGFTKDIDLTFFEDKNELIQIEFQAII